MSEKDQISPMAPIINALKHKENPCLPAPVPTDGGAGRCVIKRVRQLRFAETGLRREPFDRLKALSSSKGSVGRKSRRSVKPHGVCPVPTGCAVSFILYKRQPPCYKKWGRLIDEGDGNGKFRRSETGEPQDPVSPVSSGFLHRFHTAGGCFPRRGVEGCGRCETRGLRLFPWEGGDL
jgi:hypothetical protein